MISIQWGTSDKDGITMHAKYFSVKKLKNKKFSERIALGEFEDDDRLEKLPGALDKTLTLTSASLYSAQKLASVTAESMAKLSILTVLGRITGGIGIVENLNKYYQTGNKEFLYKAAGQTIAIGAGILTGAEEIEMIYNLGMLGYDIYEMNENKK